MRGARRAASSQPSKPQRKSKPSGTSRRSITTSNVPKKSLSDSRLSISQSSSSSRDKISPIQTPVRFIRTERSPPIYQQIQQRLARAGHPDFPKNEITNPLGLSDGTWLMPKYPDRKNVFIRVKKGPKELGVIEFKLYDSTVPKTAENFRQLCKGTKKVQNIPLHYRGSGFHRVIKGFMCQFGDFTNHNGTGGCSIYGRNFPDENLTTVHDRPYLLSMANRGPNTNGSQVFITTNPAPWLNGRHVVFGEVVAGFEVVNAIESAPTNDMDKPIEPITIIDCGEVNTI